MPVDARPEPRNPIPGTVTYRHVYRDALGRPLTGEVTLTGTRRINGDRLTVPVVPVVAKLSGGVLDVQLPPDTYQFTATLRTAEGAKVVDKGEITVG